MQVRSADADIVYDILGKGPDLVLLHPFPSNRGVWMPVAEQLATRYRVILPDLRGHGDSGVGEGPATMAKHAADLKRICDDAGVGRAIFGGCSIGGYILFEFWRSFRERFERLILCETKAAADTSEARQNRLQAAEDVLKRGTDAFIESTIPKLLGETTRTNRPDIVARARAMMQKMTPQGIAAVQRGMADRPDSVATLATVSVPTLIVVGEEDTATPLRDGSVMNREIRGSRLRLIPKAGHYSPLEQPEEVHRVIREFLQV